MSLFFYTHIIKTIHYCSKHFSNLDNDLQLDFYA